MSNSTFYNALVLVQEHNWLTLNTLTEIRNSLRGMRPGTTTELSIRAGTAAEPAELPGWHHFRACQADTLTELPGCRWPRPRQAQPVLLPKLTQSRHYGNAPTQLLFSNIKKKKKHTHNPKPLQEIWSVVWNVPIFARKWQPGSSSAPLPPLINGSSTIQRNHRSMAHENEVSRLKHDLLGYFKIYTLHGLLDYIKILIF